jgi:glycosyltransferase involved in cell wall biosynthesis
VADRIFVLSSFQKGTFMEAGVDEDKLIVTPLGVDVEAFQPMPVGRDKKVFRVAFVGQISQRKGISYLIEAFSKAAIPESELLLVGRAIGRSRAWSAIPRVRHVPHVPRWELPALYRTADVFVLPSLVEGFGLVALEAMACGVPVVISTNTFADDVVTDGVDGYIIPIRDPEAIAERLKYIYQHRAERDRIGDAGRRRAQQFSWLTYGDLIASIVRSESDRSLRKPRSHEAVTR